MRDSTSSGGNEDGTQEPGIGRSASPALKSVTGFFVAVVVVGVTAAIAYTGLSRAAATAVTWILATLLSGAAIGFLFGVPKILQQPETTTDPNAPNDAVVYRQQVNTNLTEISDWLTKIIVGLGLINLANIPIYLDQLATTLAAGLGGSNDKAFAQGLIVSFGILGFLFGYLTTRLVLASAFSKADQDALASIRRTQQEVESVQAQVASIDSRQEVLKGTLYEEKPVGESTAQRAGSEEAEERPANEQSLLLELEQMAQDYMEIDAPEYAERIKLKGRAGARMANFVLKHGITRDAVLRRALQVPENEGLVLALAMVVNAAPESTDFARLNQVARVLQRLHVRYHVVVAIIALIKAGFIGEADRKEVESVLRAIELGADGSLKSLIKQARALTASN